MLLPIPSARFPFPVSIEVFSDFQCPSCKALYEQTLRPLSEEYVAKGKVYLVHRVAFPRFHMHLFGILILAPKLHAA